MTQSTPSLLDFRSHFKLLLYRAQWFHQKLRDQQRVLTSTHSLPISVRNNVAKRLRKLDGQLTDFEARMEKSAEEEWWFNLATVGAEYLREMVEYAKEFDALVKVLHSAMDTADDLPSVDDLPPSYVEACAMRP
ncbi:hypothetical protein HK104_000113 [Borealophlyctis nickersoniae]|nr:hypothetical protein HK104_000113 [Borealophlyctis nickersoniae]